MSKALLHALGRDNLRTLSATFGGTWWLVPNAPAKPHTGAPPSPRFLALPLDLRVSLVSNFGGRRIYVPKVHGPLPCKKLVSSLCVTSKSSREIVRLLNGTISERAIEKRRAALRVVRVRSRRAGKVDPSQ